MLTGSKQLIAQLWVQRRLTNTAKLTPSSLRIHQLSGQRFSLWGIWAVFWASGVKVADIHVRTQWFIRFQGCIIVNHLFALHTDWSAAWGQTKILLLLKETRTHIIILWEQFLYFFLLQIFFFKNDKNETCSSVDHVEVFHVVLFFKPCVKNNTRLLLLYEPVHTLGFAIFFLFFSSSFSLDFHKRWVMFHH